MYVATLGKTSSAVRAVSGRYPRIRLRGLEDLAALAVATRRAPVNITGRRSLVRLNGMGEMGAAAARRSNTPTVFRFKTRLRGLGGLSDVTCSIDPLTGGRVCSNNPPAAPPAPVLPDGMLIKAGSNEVDRIEGGLRRWIPDPATFKCMNFDWSNIQNIPQEQWNAIPAGAPYPARNADCSFVGSAPAPMPITPAPVIDPSSGAPATIQPATTSSALPPPLQSTSSPVIMSSGGGSNLGQYLLYGGIGVGALIVLKMFGVIGKK